MNPNFIAKAKASDQDWTRKSGFVESKPAWSPAKAPSRGTVFQEFEYIPSLYTLADELRSEERKESEKMKEEIAGAKPFICRCERLTVVALALQLTWILRCWYTSSATRMSV